MLGPVTVSRAWYHCADCGAWPGAAGRRARRGRNVDVAGAGRNERPGGRGRAVRQGSRAAGRPGRGAPDRQAGREVRRGQRGREGRRRPGAGPSAITARKLVPLPPSPLPDKLYAAIDGTGVPVTAKEAAGRDGKGEDGRARTREVKLAVFFTQDKVDDEGYPVRDPDSSSYLATFEPASVFAGFVEAEGIRRGARHVRQFTILGDGATWICYPDVGIADLIPVTRLSRRSSVLARCRRFQRSGPG